MPYLTTRKSKATTKPWFSRLLRHPDRKWSEPFLQGHKTHIFIYLLTFPGPRRGNVTKHMAHLISEGQVVVKTSYQPRVTVASYDAEDSLCSTRVDAVLLCQYMHRFNWDTLRRTTICSNHRTIQAMQRQRDAQVTANESQDFRKSAKTKRDKKSVHSVSV